MQLTPVDIVAFVGFIAVVVGVSLYASRRESSLEGYFLAGRNLGWSLVGISLIASNISTEHFVGMAGAGFGSLGLAVAAYEWVAAVTLALVGVFLLPRFLRAGIYTVPEYLQVRFGPEPRLVMSGYMLAMYGLVALPSILYSGALGLRSIFGFDLVGGIILLGSVAGLYTIYGGLKAVVYSDLLQGVALLLGGAFVLYLGLDAVGGLGAFVEHNAERLHMVLPADHPDLPWTALLFGIWIPNFFYWGLNQFITQRTLGARSLAAGQNGILLAAGLKLAIPFIIVFPGILAHQLYGESIEMADQAYPVLISKLLPAGFRGILLAALFGAVMSSLDSLLNSASTLYTLDFHKRFRPQASSTQLVKVGRVATLALVIFGCLVAPQLERPEIGGVFKYIQMLQGFISPGIVAVFLFGLFVPRAPTRAAMTGLLLNVPVYGVLLAVLPAVSFLNHMAMTFAVIVLAMAALCAWRPLSVAFEPQTKTDLDLVPSPLAKSGAVAIVLSVVGLYLLFW